MALKVAQKHRLRDISKNDEVSYWAHA
jgi:hypothetical protein